MTIAILLWLVVPLGVTIAIFPIYHINRSWGTNEDRALLIGCWFIWIGAMVIIALTRWIP